LLISLKRVVTVLLGVVLFSIVAFKTLTFLTFHKVV